MTARRKKRGAYGQHRNKSKETILNLSYDFLMPSKRCFFHSLSVTMEPLVVLRYAIEMPLAFLHALNTAKKSLVYMPNNSHQ